MDKLEKKAGTRVAAAKMLKRRKHLFGPVFSRRLGISLGVDLIPHKTCTLDCVYCECDATTNLTLSRKEYVSTSDVLTELEEYLRQNPPLDYVTFAGSGEPLLHSGMGRIIDWLKGHFPRYAVAVLTNGTLLQQQDVRKLLSRANLVIPSLDAASEEVFQKINRPHAALKCSDFISGLIDFRREYEGRFFLEIFIIPGINDNKDELEQLQEVIGKIKPDRVQLNTLDRAGTEDWVRPASEQELKKCAAVLGPCEIIV